MEPNETEAGELVTAYTLKDPYKAEIIKNALRGLYPERRDRTPISRAFSNGLASWYGAGQAADRLLGEDPRATSGQPGVLEARGHRDAVKQAVAEAAGCDFRPPMLARDS